jgi:MFS family permease
VLATFIAIAFIDRLGRRPLLLAGLVGMGISLAVVGAASFADLHGVVTLIALVAFIVSFAFSLGPVVWTVINEIFPGAIRGRAVAFATAINWASAFVVSQFFLSLVNLIGEAQTFWLFSSFCAAALVWVYLRVPETKGRSLEEIEKLWHQR